MDDMQCNTLTATVSCAKNILPYTRPHVIMSCQIGSATGEQETGLVTGLVSLLIILITNFLSLDLSTIVIIWYKANGIIIDKPEKIKI